MATVRVLWISEVQNKYARRALLLATAPMLVAFNLVTATVGVALWIIYSAIVAYPKALYRGWRLVWVSIYWRWSHAKPKGADDFVSLLLRLDESSAERVSEAVATWKVEIHAAETEAATGGHR